jgi:hypothetical protein
MPNTVQSQSKSKIRVRRPYHKPKVEKVALVLEEAVLGTGCKTPTSAGPYNGSCVDNFVPCLIEGS